MFFLLALLRGRPQHHRRQFLENMGLPRKEDTPEMGFCRRSLVQLPSPPGELGKKKTLGAKCGRGQPQGEESSQASCTLEQERGKGRKIRLHELAQNMCIRLFKVVFFPRCDRIISDRQDCTMLWMYVCYFAL